MRSAKTILSLVAIAAIVPLALYLFNFPHGLSDDISDWAAFGSYIGGVYGAMAFVAVAISLHLTRTQFAIQHEEDVFYKATESLQARIIVTLNESSDKAVNESVAKASTAAFFDELKSRSAHMARKILCTNPNIISNTNLNKIVNAINSDVTDGNNYSKKSFIDGINARQTWEQKWEFLKGVLGGLDNESNEVKKALRDAGSVSFYKADFAHREYYYEHAWEAANQRYSEEISLYIRKINFILSHISGARRKNKYEKYLLSQLSKYDISFVFCYALVCKDLNMLELFSNCGLLKESQIAECSLMMFDCPSEEEISAELKNIEERVNKLLKSGRLIAAV
tara:strand:- start:21546 stop:22559 length:1014 start_codon:yes stop_codon:yes gene_type:complete